MRLAHQEPMYQEQLVLTVRKACVWSAPMPLLVLFVRIPTFWTENVYLNAQQITTLLMTNVSDMKNPLTAQDTCYNRCAMRYVQREPIHLDQPANNV